VNNNRRIALDRAEAINHQNGNPYMKSPKVTALKTARWRSILLGA
jgi:hypothetical protein